MAPRTHRRASLSKEPEKAGENIDRVFQTSAWKITLSAAVNESLKLQTAMHPRSGGSSGAREDVGKLAYANYVEINKSDPMRHFRPGNSQPPLRATHGASAIFGHINLLFPLN